MRKLVLVAWLAACGGSDGDGGGSIAVEEFDDAYADAICTFYVNCGVLEDRSQCALIDHEGQSSAASVAGVLAGTVTYDADAAAACISRFTTSCERFQVFGLTTAAGAACSRIFQGTVAAGGACTSSVQCASDSCDLPCAPDTCCEGTCIGDVPSLVFVALGEACGDGTICTESYCDRTTATPTCAALKPDGSACNEGLECATRNCEGDVCTAQVATGGTCSSDDDCLLFSDTCHSVTQTCTPLGLTADTCTTRGDCSPVYDCDPAGTCTLGPRLGETCTTSARCIDATYCDPATSTCIARKPDGAACVDEGECAGYCSSAGVCATQPICS